MGGFVIFQDDGEQRCARRGAHDSLSLRGNYYKTKVSVRRTGCLSHARRSLQI